MTHTIAKIFKHEAESKSSTMTKEWVVYNKLENFNSLLNYTIDDFTPSGNYFISMKMVKCCIKHIAIIIQPQMVHTTSP